VRFRFGIHGDTTENEAAKIPNASLSKELGMKKEELGIASACFVSTGKSPQFSSAALLPSYKFFIVPNNSSFLIPH
jgi:hypothetical protein